MLFRHLSGAVILAFTLATGAAAGDLDPPGAPASTPPLEARTAITALPATIEGPGSFYLVSNLTGVAGSHGIVLSGESITLDLNGFSLIGVPGSMVGIRMQGSEQSVINGTIRDWGQQGILLGAHSLLEGLRVVGCGDAGVTGGSRAVVRDCTFRENGGNGLRVTGDALVERCTAADNVFNGFVLESGSQGIGLVATSNGARGIAGGGDSSIADSNASDNGDVGIRILQGTLSGCTATGNFGGGFEARGATIVNCTAFRNRVDEAPVGTVGYGFRLIEESHLESSTAVDDNGIGIIVEDNSTVLNCTVTDAADGTNLVGSRAGILVTGAGNRIDGNSLSNNSTNGILVSGTDNLVVRNTVTDSGDAFNIGANNAFGPEIDVAQIGDITAAAGDTHPWANFEF